MVKNTNLNQQTQLDIFGFSDAETQQLLKQKMRGLPHSVQKLIKILGEVSTYHFLLKRGGTQLFVPINAKKCYLLEDMSQQELTQFIAIFNPDGLDHHCVKLPKTDKLVAALRNQAICTEKQQGQTLNTLAIKYNLTSRHISNIIKNK